MNLLALSTREEDHRAKAGVVEVSGNSELKLTLKVSINLRDNEKVTRRCLKNHLVSNDAPQPQGGGAVLPDKEKLPQRRRSDHEAMSGTSNRLPWALARHNSCILYSVCSVILLKNTKARD